MIKPLPQNLEQIKNIETAKYKKANLQVKNYSTHETGVISKGPLQGMTIKIFTTERNYCCALPPCSTEMNGEPVPRTSQTLQKNKYLIQGSDWFS